MSASPLVVYVDTTSVMHLGFTTGIQRVVRQLVPRLARRPDLDVRLLRFDPMTAGWEELEPSSALANLEDSTTVPLTARPLPLEEWEAGSVFLDIDATWNHQLRRSTLFPLLRERGIRIVCYLYDVGPLKLPQFAEGRTTANFTVWLAAVMTWADLVVADSHNAESEFLSYQARVGVERWVPTLVTRLGADLPRRVIAGADELSALRFLDEPYLLFVGTIEPRKRQLLALEAFDLLAVEHPDVHLVFAGRQGWLVDDVVDRIQQHPRYGARVHWVQAPDDAVLSTLYERATMCLYLSRLEGYGLPVAEALGHRKVTLASRIGAVYEVARETCDYTWFDSPVEVAETLALYLDDPRLLEQREQHVAGFRPLSWDRVAATLGEAVVGLPGALAASGDRTARRTLSFDGTLLGRPEKAAALAALDAHGAEVLHYVQSSPMTDDRDDLALNLEVTRRPTTVAKMPATSDAVGPGIPAAVRELIGTHDLAHGLLRFDAAGLTVLVGGIPQLLTIDPEGSAGLDVVVHTTADQVHQVEVRLGGGKVAIASPVGYQVGRHVLAVPAQDAEIAELELGVVVDGVPVDLGGRRYVVVALTTDDVARTIRRLRRRV